MTLAGHTDPILPVPGFDDIVSEMLENRPVDRPIVFVVLHQENRFGRI